MQAMSSDLTCLALQSTSNLCACAFVFSPIEICEDKLRCAEEH